MDFSLESEDLKRFMTQGMDIRQGEEFGPIIQLPQRHRQANGNCQNQYVQMHCKKKFNVAIDGMFVFPTDFMLKSNPRCDSVGDGVFGR